MICWQMFNNQLSAEKKNRMLSVMLSVVKCICEYIFTFRFVIFDRGLLGEGAVENALEEFLQLITNFS